VELAVTSNGSPRGFAYATYADDTTAELAIEALAGKEVEGRPVKVRVQHDARDYC